MMIAESRIEGKLAPVLNKPGVQNCLNKNAAELYQLSRNLPVRFINNDEGDAYFERYFLDEEDLSFAYLHRFVNSDGRDVGLHNHPWKYAFSQILTGEYEQEVIDGRLIPGRAFKTKREIYKAGSSQIILGQTFHKIVQVQKETWTVFVHSHWTKEWGFLHGEGPDHRFESYKSNPDRRWWLNAPKASDIQTAPFLPSCAPY